MLHHFCPPLPLPFHGFNLVSPHYPELGIQSCLSLEIEGKRGANRESWDPFDWLQNHGAPSPLGYLWKRNDSMITEWFIQKQKVSRSQGENTQRWVLSVGVTVFKSSTGKDGGCFGSQLEGKHPVRTRTAWQQEHRTGGRLASTVWTWGRWALALSFLSLLNSAQGLRPWNGATHI